MWYNDGVDERPVQMPTDVLNVGNSHEFQFSFVVKCFQPDNIFEVNLSIFHWDDGEVCVVKSKVRWLPWSYDIIIRPTNQHHLFEFQ